MSALLPCLVSSAQSDLPGSLLDCYQFEGGKTRVNHLIAGLREISGLAITPNNTLLAHNDEQTTIYEIAPKTARIMAVQTDLAQSSRIDFEGIAIAGNSVFLVSSKGNFARTRYPLNQAPFDFWTSKLGEICEIEGLTSGGNDRTLVAACKKIARPKNKREIRLLVITPGQQNPAPGEISTIIPKHHESGIKQFSGSGVVYYEPLHHYLVLSSREPAIAELSASGDLLNLVALPKRLHRQPEGIAITAENALIIANEGGKGEGYLVTYEPRDNCPTQGGTLVSTTEQGQ